MTAALTDLATGLEFPEGPIAMKDGSVLLVEIARGTVTRVGPDGSVDVVAEPGGGPNGAAIGPDGKVYVANNGASFAYVDMGGMLFPVQPNPAYEGGRIERVDIETGEVDVLYEACDGRPLRGPNDLVFDGQGGFWFTDHGIREERRADRTGVYYAKADGSHIHEAIAPLDSPNGIGLSPSGDRVYVAETFTCALWGWKVTGPGEVEQVPGVFPHGGVFVGRPAGLAGFDSLGVDGEGNVCVATLAVGGAGGGITSFAPDGSAAEYTDCGDLLTTNICFGGEDLRTAYVTLSGSGRLASLEWPRAGLALAHAA